MKPRHGAYAAAVVLVVAYAWLATDVEPFHVLSYVVIALPVLVVAGLYGFVGTFADGRSGVAHYDRGRSLRVPLSRSKPWIAVLAGAVVLEAVGLILGGHSSRVPTLSTMVDHLLTTHGLRCVLFLLWLVVGVAPLRRLSQRQRGASE